MQDAVPFGSEVLSAVGVDKSRNRIQALLEKSAETGPDTFLVTFSGFLGLGWLRLPLAGHISMATQAKKGNEKEKRNARFRLVFSARCFTKGLEWTGFGRTRGRGPPGNSLYSMV